MYQWLIFAHILGVFGFLFAHGASAAVAFALPRQREVERIRALLDLSRGVATVGSVSLLILLAAGITLGFIGSLWNQGWIWISLGLFILIGITMTPLGSRPLNRIRQTIDPAATKPANSRSSADTAMAMDKQLPALLAATHPWLLTIVGGGGLVLILWLMLFKPF
jgi:hypothetical protein